MTEEQSLNGGPAQDTISRLSQASGLDREQILETWERVKANREKAESCPGHRFEGSLLSPFGSKTCTRCGAEISKAGLMHYMEGYHAAGGDARDVWPAYAKAFSRFDREKAS